MSRYSLDRLLVDSTQALANGGFNGQITSVKISSDRCPGGHFQSDHCEKQSAKSHGVGRALAVKKVHQR